MALYNRQRTRPPVSPALVVGLEGWVDAGLGADTAIRSLLSNAQTEVVATFDSDALIDYRARRPVVTITEGINTGLRWQVPELRLGQDLRGNDVCFLVGPEPDMRWREFASCIVELAKELNVRLAVGLGAFPAAAPHTRPIRLAATATDASLARQVGSVNGTIEVPAGVEAALEQAFCAGGIPAVGLWARVPHYVAAMAYPAAAAALVDGLSSVADLAFDSSALHGAADQARSRVDALIAESEEHTQMVRQLEISIDAAEGTPLNIGEVPSGDEIAAELQRYLRDEGERRGGME